MSTSLLGREYGIHYKSDEEIAASFLDKGILIFEGLQALFHLFVISFKIQLHSGCEMACTQEYPCIILIERLVIIDIDWGKRNVISMATLMTSFSVCLIDW